MSDLDDFRAALQRPDPDLRPLDIAAIMTAGNRLRRRRRLTTAAGSALTVVALLIGGSQLIPPRPTEPASAPVIPSPAAAAPMATPPAEQSAPPPSRRTAPTRSPVEGLTAPPEDTPIGEIVRTGVQGPKGEWLLYAVPIDSAESPGVDFGVMMGYQLPDGTLVDVILANETDGSARTPGFHALSSPQNIDGADTPAFGYYVGAAERITGQSGARTRTAQHQQWSEDPSVRFVWFDLDVLPAGDPLSDLKAYDRTGRPLPAGRAVVTNG